MTTVNNSISNLVNDIANNTVSTGVTYSKSELETLFEDTGYFNAGETGQAQIQEQIDNLEATISALKAEAEDLQEQIDEKSEEVDDVGTQMDGIIGKINSSTTDFQKSVKKAAQAAAQTALADYKKNGSGGGTSFEEYFDQSFDKKMSGTSLSMGTIQAYYAEFENLKTGISPLMGQIDSLVSEVSVLQTRLNSTNATLNLLNTTKNNMTDTIQGAYSNCDTNTATPIYSGAKAELANSLLETYTSRYVSEGDGDATTTTGSAEAAAETQSKYLELKGNATYTSGDKYSVDTNPELANLRTLIADGMIEDLQASGMNVDEIMTFISENWNVGITKQDDGTWKIPKGHSSDAWVNEPAYNALTSLVTGDTGTATTADDVNQTQLAELTKAVNEDGILTQMYESGFTYKEAMYVLTQLFPDAGIEYDLSEQSGTRTYSIAEDTDSSNGIYATISSQILDYWNVGGETLMEEEPSTNAQVTKYDPITFQVGNSTYTFITDRDGDNEFDYTDGSTNELLGSEQGIEELLAYDYNGDGVIDEKDVDSDGNYALDQLTLLVNNQIESVADGDDVDSYKNGSSYTNSVDFDVTYTSARLAGITSIDLSSLTGSGSGDSLESTTKTYDNVTEGYDDINGSSVINQFAVTINGETVTASETLNSESNLETFYGTVADNASTVLSTISGNEFESAFDNWYNDDFEAVGDLLDNVAESAEALKAKAENLDCDGSLNIDWEDFQEMYGTTGKDGTYVATAKEIAANTAAQYETTNGNELAEKQEEAYNAVGEALDEYNESVQVELASEKDVDTDMGATLEEE